MKCHPGTIYKIVFRSSLFLPESLERFQFSGSAFYLVRNAANVKLISKDLHKKRVFGRAPLAVITYKNIFKESHLAYSLLGMSLEQFEELYAQFEPAYQAHESNLLLTRRDKLKRRRRIGAGPKHKYTLRDRLLMTLFWLRANTTYEVIGSFYDLDKTTVEDNIKNVLDTLTTISSFDMELPCSGIPKLRSMQDVINAFPDIRLILDIRE